MSNLEVYDNVFKQTFMVDIDTLHNDFKMAGNELWDSVGHMSLVSCIEDAFGITLETDDIINFDSFQKGIEILKKYGVQF